MSDAINMNAQRALNRVMTDAELVINRYTKLGSVSLAQIVELRLACQKLEQTMKSDNITFINVDNA